ncbi:structure-specific endonuclease subunit SLX4 [Clonorchis sinensis]|uniref:Structure-specific endonuclease subunit SLX4 n=1 Tax=Clonorchis sinensis TaxID=79923 RepID=H2KQR2_CLOSI|nr:structure-specific endonuclease subunit SLX4 [Clonorchis sinensis]
MAAGDVGGHVSESSPNVPYYVKALVPPLSPTTITWGENLLSLSQLPGRSSSHSPTHVVSPPNALLSTEPTFPQTQGFIPDGSPSMDHPQLPIENPVCPHSPILIKIGEDSGSEKSKPSSENPVYGSRYLSMVGESSWSDAILILDDGQRVPVHKFVFAAWGIVSSVFPNGARSSMVTGITAPEVFQLLELLYRGDEHMLCQDWNNQSQLVQDKLRSWGVRPCAGAKSPRGVAEVSFFSKKQNSPRNVTTGLTDEQIAHVQLPSTSFHECSAVRSSELTTPVVSGSTKRQPEPQFSRDLFSSPWESMCIVSHPADVAESPTEELSIRLSPPVLGSERQCPSTSPKRSPKLTPAFDEQPTPCPLFKRLCSSNTLPSPESEPPNQQSSVISPPNSPSPELVVNTATPHLSKGLQDKSSTRSPPHIPQDSMSDINFGSWSSPLSTFGNSTLHSSPVTPLPDYKTMMTPELKRALSAFGVRPLPRKRAVTLLNEIYHQLHQYTTKLQTGPMDSLSEQSTSTGTSKPPPMKRPRSKKRSSSNVAHTITSVHPKRTCEMGNSAADATSSVSCSTGDYGWSDDDAPNDVDNRFEVNDLDDSQRLEATGQVDIKRSVIAYIRSQKELYKNILTYTVSGNLRFAPDHPLFTAS